MTVNSGRVRELWEKFVLFCHFVLSVRVDGKWAAGLRSWDSEKSMLELDI